mmetsp:Transcript_116677/g.330035  ORF Transcript_116677/g.330035 Transcript_116677/m.330035 type:complete len:292 (+) Transcript_116677:1087-1962(+)
MSHLWASAAARARGRTAATPPFVFRHHEGGRGVWRGHRGNAGGTRTAPRLRGRWLRRFKVDALFFVDAVEAARARGQQRWDDDGNLWIDERRFQVTHQIVVTHLDRLCCLEFLLLLPRCRQPRASLALRPRGARPRLRGRRCRVGAAWCLLRLGRCLVLNGHLLRLRQPFEALLVLRARARPCRRASWPRHRAQDFLDPIWVVFVRLLLLRRCWLLDLHRRWPRILHVGRARVLRLLFDSWRWRRNLILRTCRNNREFQSCACRRRETNGRPRCGRFGFRPHDFVLDLPAR